MTPRLIAFDLDGTLSESRSPMTPNMASLFERWLFKHPAAVMSGTTFAHFEQEFIPSIPPNARLEHLYLFADNAAECFKFTDGAWKPLYALPFSDKEKHDIRNALATALLTTGLSETGPLPKEWGERIQDRGSQISFSYFGADAPIEEKDKWDPTMEKRRTLQAALIPLLKGFTVSIGGRTTIDIIREGVDKSYGLMRLAEITRIPVTEMMYVGDDIEEGGNDFIVRKTGVMVTAVKDPTETEKVLADLLAKK